MFQEDPTGANADPAVTRIATAPKNNDYDYLRDVQRFFGERFVMHKSLGTEEGSLIADQSQELQRGLELLAFEDQKDKVKPEDVACALADVAYVMSNNNPNIAENEPVEDGPKTYEASRKVFMKSGEKLWPEVKGDETGFRLARARLARNEGEFLSARTTGDILLRVGEHDKGRPPSNEVVRRRIDNAVAFAQDTIGMKTWNLMTRSKDDQLVKGGRITDGDKQVIASVMKDLYVVEKYKDNLK